MSFEDIREFDLAKKLADGRIIDTFAGGIVKWKGPRDARFLILTDHPSHKDVGDNGVIDSERLLKKRFDKIFMAAFNKGQLPRNRYAIASCCVGWEANWWRYGPTAVDLDVSIGYLTSLLSSMPKLEMILCVGLYATEVCHRNFDIHAMYGRPRTEELRIVDETSPTMMSRKRFDKVEHCILNNDRVLRYLQVAPYDNTTNNAFVTGSIFSIDHFAKPPPMLKHLDVRDHDQLKFPDSSRYILSLDQFKTKLHGELKDTRNERLLKLSQGNEEADDGLFVDASLDPYIRNPPENKSYYVMNYQLEYDHGRNCMYMHGATPAGSSILVTFTDVIFTFWIRPNVAFADPQHPENWCDIVKQIPLHKDHLSYLQDQIRRRLFHTIKQRGTGNSDPKKSFEISVEKQKRDYKDGYIHGRFFDFIRIDVSNYAFIEVITKLLDQLNKKYLKDHKHEAINKKNASILEYMQARNDVYEIFSPTQMFGNRYHIMTSHWHRIDDMVMDPLMPLLPEEDIYHTTHLTASVQMPPQVNLITCLEPLSKEPLGYNGMTSFDMPKAVQTGFDIEAGKFDRYYGGAKFWNTPVICLGIVGRKCDDKVDTFEAESFEAKEGYKYYGFMMGTVTDIDTETTELRGSEVLYEFASEKVMFEAYLYFYTVMKARYWVTHNGKNYDLPLMLRRAKVLGIELGSFGYIANQITRITERQFNSRAHSERTIFSLEGECGITQMDTCEIFMRERKDRSSTLGFLSKTLVKMTKNDMPYEAIMGHWKESDESRRTLLDYCYRDAQLPLQLIAHSKLVVAVNQLSRASGFISEGLISEKGMQEKVLGAFFKANYQEGMIYILRTNDYFSKKYNTELLLTVRDLIDEYQANAEGTQKHDENMQVAAVQLGKRSAAQAAASHQSETKRQRTHIRKVDKGSEVKPTGILSFFRKATTLNSVPHEEDTQKQKDLPKITATHWEKISRKRFAHTKIAEDDDTEDTKEDGYRSYDDEEVESNKGKIKERPAEPPPVLSKFAIEENLHLSLKGAHVDTLPVKTEKCIDDGEEREEDETVKKQRIQQEFQRAKASRNDMANRDAEYQGAVVMNEKLGWYHDLPALCIDFASLYPSIMMENNQGSNTKIYEDEMEERGVTMDMVCEPAKEQRVTNPRTGRKCRLFFLKKTVWKGLLAVAEFMLLKLRNEAKELIEFFGNEFLSDGVTPNPNFNKVMAAVALAASNNIKLLMNSMYGVKGADGVLEDRHIAGSVTACGREAIMLAKNKTMKRYNAICVGGDTDSVFMQFPGLAKGQFERKWAKACRLLEQYGPDHEKTAKAKFPALPDGWWRLKEMDAITKFAFEEWVPRINRNFRWPMKVDFEKAMYRFIAFAKKRYSFFYAFVGKKPWLANKGLETIRRDALPFTQKVLKELFDTIQVMPQKSPYTFDEDPDGSRADKLDLEFIRELKKKAVALIRKYAQQLARGEVSILDLILSKQRSREYYTNQNQEHLTVVRKLEERGEEAPPVGSRIFFVYTLLKENVKGVPLKGFEKADDPEYVVREGIPIDYMYYLNNKFIKSIVRVMRYFLYDEMVQRVSKRKYDEYNYGISNTRSAKRAKITLDKDGNIPITLKEVTEETEQYLFGTAQSGNVNARNIQTRYLGLTGNKVHQAHVNKKDRSTIVNYAQKDETLFDTLRRKYETNDHRIILNKEVETMQNSAEAYSKCLSTCRKCLKIPQEKPVLCVAPHCEQYLPRISALRTHIEVEERVTELCTDLEDLFISKNIMHSAVG